MYQVLKAKKDGTFLNLKTFATYKQAYYFVAEKYIRQGTGMHYSFGLKYLMDGYDKSKLFKFGCLDFKHNSQHFKIQENAVQVRENTAC